MALLVCKGHVSKCLLQAACHAALSDAVLKQAVVLVCLQDALCRPALHAQDACHLQPPALHHIP